MMKNPTKLENAIEISVEMLRSFLNPKNPDDRVPATLIRHCEGIAFLRIFKAGLFFLGGNVAGGCVIAKVKDTSVARGYRWSAPVSIVCGGLGGGFVFGAEMIDSIIILNHGGAVRAFTGKGQVSFGGNVSLAAGPYGRDIEAHLAASANKEIAAAYSYSQAKGVYIGGTLEGALLLVKNEETQRFYNSPNATAENCILGTFDAVPYQAQALARELDAVVDRKGLYANLSKSVEQGGDPTAQGDLAKSGRSLVRQGFSGSGQGELPPGWEEFKSPDGTPYYFNAKTNVTQWDRPAAVAPPAPPVASRAPPVPPPPASLPPRPSSAPKVKVLYDYTAASADELSISVGEELVVLEKVDQHWWKGRNRAQRVGLFPVTYVQSV